MLSDTIDNKGTGNQDRKQEDISVSIDNGKNQEITEKDIKKETEILSNNCNNTTLESNKRNNDKPTNIISSNLMLDTNTNTHTKDNDTNVKNVIEEELDISSFFTKNIKKLEYLCRPDIQEFENPLNYIETLNLKLKEYGACKIIPPTSWNPTQLNNFKVTRKNFF